MNGINRRDFLKIVLTTVSTAALSGPLALVWPTEKKGRPVADPWVVDREYCYLMDPDWTEEDWPSFRELWYYNDLSLKEKVQTLIDHFGYDQQSLADEFEIVKPSGGWSYQELAEIETILGDVLDEPADPENLSFHQLLTYGPQRAGNVILDNLPASDCDRLGIYLVEGEHPGSDFCAVRYEGALDDLNLALARNGLNTVVRDITS